MVKSESLTKVDINVAAADSRWEVAMRKVREGKSEKIVDKSVGVMVAELGEGKRMLFVLGEKGCQWVVEEVVGDKKEIKKLTEIVESGSGEKWLEEWSVERLEGETAIAFGKALGLEEVLGWLGGE